MAADISSVAKLLRREAGKKGGPEIVTMDLLGGCGGSGVVEDKVVDLELTVPAGFERRLDFLSGNTFLTPRHPSVHQSVIYSHQHQDLNLPVPAAALAGSTTSAMVCTLNMVRSTLECATAAGTTATSPATSSTTFVSTSSLFCSTGKRNRSPPLMRAIVCPSCFTYVLITDEDPSCPRCAAIVPPLTGKSASTSAAPSYGSGKKPRINLNAAPDETE